jgi:hypothetical protein
MKNSPRKVRISRAYKNKVHVPSIRLMGKWLMDAGLSYGDTVNVTIDPITNSLTLVRSAS